MKFFSLEILLSATASPLQSLVLRGFRTEVCILGKVVLPAAYLVGTLLATGKVMLLTLSSILR